VLKKKTFTSISVSPKFSEFSLDNNYIASDFISDIDTLIAMWERQGYIDVYDHPINREHGRIKPSEIDGSGYFVYQYCGVYHARLMNDGKHDPLLILKFMPDEDGQERVTLRFITDHDLFFGTTYERNRPVEIRAVRNKNGNVIDIGDKFEKGNLLSEHKA
jgi:hypothetical protein